MIAAWTLACLWLAALAGAPQEPAFDPARVDRTLERVPELRSPLYGIFLFGPEAKTRVFAILDRSGPEADLHDVLYFDLDADGDLTEPEERFSGERIEVVGKGAYVGFDLTPPHVPGERGKASGLRLTYSKDHVSFRMQRADGLSLQVGFRADDPLHFAASADASPVVVVGPGPEVTARLLWPEELARGEDQDLQVFFGHEGSSAQGFGALGFEVAGKAGYARVTLEYVDRTGRSAEVVWELLEPC